MRNILAAGFALALLIGSARAATILHLSATASVQTMPDELTAELAAEAHESAPAVAQTDVNAMIRRALAAAHAVSAVTTSTGAYSVWYVTDPHPEWQARQTLVLTAHDGPALLGLVGQLQAQGLAVSSLGWQLAAKTMEAAQDKAQLMALAQLRGRAEAAAKVLGMRFAGFQEVWLTPAGPTSPIQPMALMAARGVPPSAIPAESAVVASVAADVVLDPAQP
jgi:uncharacterized protein